MSIRSFAVTVAAGLMLWPASSFAHAELASANPPANGTVQVASRDFHHLQRGGGSEVLNHRSLRQ